MNIHKTSKRSHGMNPAPEVDISFSRCLHLIVVTNKKNGELMHSVKCPHDISPTQFSHQIIKYRLIYNYSNN
jgi:hypothetical protein